MMKLKSYAGALLATTLLTACNVDGGSGAISTVKSALNPVINSNFAIISAQISELEQAVSFAQSSASLSALLNPTDKDKALAGDIVTRIDNVIAGWEEHKAGMSQGLLRAKLGDAGFRKAEAVVKLLKDELRPMINDVTAGKGYDTNKFKFLANKESLDKVINEKQALIFDQATPTVISASTSSVTVAQSSAVNSPDKVKETIVTNSEQIITGGANQTDLTRTASWTETTTKKMHYDRTWTVSLQNITNYVFSDGTTKQEKGAVREIPNKQTLDIADVVNNVAKTSNITYTVDDQNTPVTVVTRGETAVGNVYEDRIETITQADTSKLHNTIRKTTKTSTTPVTTTLTYPKIKVYTYTDGHAFTWDDTDQIDATTVDEVIVDVSEAITQATTEHVVANENITNEVITEEAEADPVFATVYEDKTSDVTVDTTKTTTVTRHYTTTATIVTTTTVKTTPVTKQVWTDGEEKLIRGETVTTTNTENTVVTDTWTKVMSEVATTVDDAVVAEPEADPIDNNSDHADMGTRTLGYNTDANSYKTSEFNGSGTNYKAAINAHVAYSRGWTGKGSLITIADTGFDKDHSDLAGAVKYQFNTLTDGTNTFMDDNVGHGSHVLGIAAGRKNGTGTHGVAYDADVAVVKVTDSSGYSFQRARIGAAWARDLGSIAFNISANWNEDSTFRNSITAIGTTGVSYSNHYYYGEHGYNGAVDEAKEWKIALGTEQILVNSAGNFAKDYVSGSAQMAHATGDDGKLILGGRMLIVGSYNMVNNAIDSYSSKAGTVCATYDFTGNVCKDAAKASDFYILAPGDQINSAYKDGTQVTMSGTSMAAPVVTGSLAILHQMWPHMKGENLVQLVLKTANKDLPGYAEYTHGQGLLDLDKATQPVGATGIPTSGRTNGQISNLATLSGGAGIGNISSGAFAALSNVMVLDEFERDFSINLNNTQAVDTRPGGLAESIAHAGQGAYDGYWNLARAGELTMPEVLGVSASFKMDPEAKADGDMGIKVGFDVHKDDDTSLKATLGFLKETEKFLNNVQQGYMGVGDTHTTQYAGLNLNHKFNNSWFAFGNAQMGYTDVEASKEFSLVTGYSGLVSSSWGLGAGYKTKNGFTITANLSQPLSVMSGRMNYKVPTARTTDGAVQFNEGSADASTTNIEHDLGFSVSYNIDNVSFAGYAEHRNNVAGVAGNTETNTGVKVKLTW